MRDSEIACDSCGLTMGESRKLAALRAQADARPFGWWYSDKTGEHFSKRGPDSYAPGDLSEYEVKVTPLYTHPEASASGLSEREIADTVNKVRDIALQFHATQQLRERISRVLVPILTRASAATVGEASEKVRELARAALAKRSSDNRTDEQQAEAFADFVCYEESEAAQQQAEPVWTEDLIQKVKQSAKELGAKIKPGRQEQQAEHVGQACGDSAEHVGIQQAEPGADEVERAAIAMHAMRRDLANGVGDRTFDMEFDNLPDEIKEVDRALARAAIIAAQSGQRAGVADGWKLVPIKPTFEMLEAGDCAWDSSAPDRTRHVYKAMLAAAPTQQQEGGS